MDRSYMLGTALRQWVGFCVVIVLDLLTLGLAVALFIVPLER